VSYIFLTVLATVFLHLIDFNYFSAEIVQNSIPSLNDQPRNHKLNEPWCRSWPISDPGLPLWNLVRLSYWQSHRSSDLRSTATFAGPTKFTFLLLVLLSLYLESKFCFLQCTGFRLFFNSERSSQSLFHSIAPFAK